MAEAAARNALKSKLEGTPPSWGLRVRAPPALGAAWPPPPGSSGVRAQPPFSAPNWLGCRVILPGAGAAGPAGRRFRPRARGWLATWATASRPGCWVRGARKRRLRRGVGQQEQGPEAQGDQAGEEEKEDELLRKPQPPQGGRDEAGHFPHEHLDPARAWGTLSSGRALRSSESRHLSAAGVSAS